jgi:hypothetical protein
MELLHFQGSPSLVSLWLTGFVTSTPKMEKTCFLNVGMDNAIIILTAVRTSEVTYSFQFTVCQQMSVSLSTTTTIAEPENTSDRQYALPFTLGLQCTTELCGRVVNTPASDTGAPGFKSRPGDRIY